MGCWEMRNAGFEPASGGLLVDCGKGMKMAGGDCCC
jgi:hypothetical protein